MVGIGAGVAYALARRRIGWADKGHGLLFGALFSLAFDEALTPVVGFAEPPQAYPCRRTPAASWGTSPPGWRPRWSWMCWMRWLDGVRRP